MMCGMLRLDGWRVNVKRVHRLWKREGFKVPGKQHKRRRFGHSENGVVRRRAEHKNHVWCVDFIHDRDDHDRPLKWLSVVDEFTRECVLLEVERGMTSDDVVDRLVEAFKARGVPAHIRSDNGKLCKPGRRAHAARACGPRAFRARRAWRSGDEPSGDRPGQVQERGVPVPGRG
jgi:transposase InsO family protein